MWSAALAALVAGVVLAACGGGGGSTAGATGASAFAVGPIRGFGSIIVNGVRFDDSGAHIEDDEGNGRGSDDLRLGSMVEIESGRIDDSTGRAKASTIRIGSELIGQVESVSGSSFVMLGQTVDVTADTVFDDSLALGSAGLAGLQGLVVEVHAQFDAGTGHYVATRIEAERAALEFKIRGAISALDKDAKTFQIGTAVINYAAVTNADLPANLANGQVLRVKVKPQPENGQWIATSVRNGERRVDDHDDGRLVGQVTGFRSATDFDVNGVKVDASNASIDKGPVTAQSRVEVRGRVREGTLAAERVKVLDGSDDMIRGVELHGSIGNLNRETRTFVVRGVTVSFAGAVTYERGSEAQLADNQPVEVKGALASDGKTLNATLIRFED
jgi:hypothetical protein